MAGILIKTILTTLQHIIRSSVLNCPSLLASSYIVFNSLSDWIMGMSIWALKMKRVGHKQFKLW